MAHKEWMQETRLNVRSSNRRLGVAAERINYLCSHSWGESSRFEARPTEAVYTDRKVRGHASKHVVGAKLQGLRAGHQGREWLEIYYSFSAKSCSLYMYQWHGASMYKTSEHKYRRAACTRNNTWIITDKILLGYDLTEAHTLCLLGHWLTPKWRTSSFSQLFLRFIQLNPFTFKHSSARPN